MLMAILLLILVTGIGIAGIQHAGSEASGTARGRRAAMTFYAADSGIQMVMSKID